MPTENQDHGSVVMGFPAEDLYRPPRRYEEPTTTAAAGPPLPKPRPYHKWLIIPLILITTLLSVSLYLYIKHQNMIRSPIIQIQSITLSNVTSSSPNTVTAAAAITTTNWNITFSLENPNRQSPIHYRMIHVWVSDKNRGTLSSGNLDYFYLDKSEEGDVNVEISELVVDFGKRRMNGVSEVVLSLKLEAMVWYAKKRWQLLEASCGDVKVRPPMRLTLDGSGRCNVELQ